MPLKAETARDWIQRSRDALEEWRSEAEDAFKFVGGEQIREDDQAELEKKLRAIAVFNRIGPIINAVVGAEVANRMEPSVRPMEVDDRGTAEVLTSAVIWMRELCQADAEQSDAFRDLVTCGIGWTETRPDYDGERPDVIEERVDPIDVVWDHRSSKRNVADRRWTARALPLPVDEAIDLWPDRTPSEMNAQWFVGGARSGTKTRSGLPGEAYDAGRPPIEGEPDNRVVYVVQVEWWEREKAYRIAAQGRGEAVVTGVEDRKAVEEELIGLGIPYEVTAAGKRKVYWRGVLGADDWLESNRMDPQQGGFRFKAMTGYRQRLDNGGYAWTGLAKLGMDPQRWANKFMMEILYLIQVSPLGGVIAEEDAFVDQAQAEKKLRTPGGVVLVNRGQLANVKELPSASMPPAIAAMMEFALRSIRDCMGVTEEMLGQAARVQAGVVERQRRQSSMNMLATLFDALTQFREDQARLMVHMVLTHMADGRMVRLAGRREGQYVELLPPQNEVEYDIRVTQSPTTIDAQQEAWDFIVSMLPHLKEANLPPEIWAEIIRYSPLPMSLADRISEHLEKPPDVDPEAQKRQQLAIQLAMEQAAADVGETKARTEAQLATAAEKKAGATENLAEAVLDLARARGEADGMSLQAARDALATAQAMGEAVRAKQEAEQPPQAAQKNGGGNAGQSRSTGQ